MEKTIRLEQILRIITEIRNKKGYSYENMAADLGISTSAYRKIEIGETRLSVERLLQIAEILDTSVIELMDLKRIENTSSDQAVLVQIQKTGPHLYREKQDIVQDLLNTKDMLIAQLQQEIRFYKDSLEK